MIKINEQTIKNYLFTVLLLVTVAAISDAFYNDVQRDNNEKMMLEYFERQEKNTLGKTPAEKNFMDYLMLRDPTTNLVPFERLAKAEKQAKESRKLYPRSSSTLSWESMGPTTIGGRTRAIMMDPNDATGKGMWLGSVSGGLWYTNDIFSDSYTMTRKDNDWSNISVTALAYDPNNTNILYAGGGERVGYQFPGEGIWKSTDSGATWNLLSSTSGFKFIEDIVVRNENGTSAIYASIGMASLGPAAAGNGPNNTWATGNEGVAKSTDGGATWSTQVAPSWEGDKFLHYADLHIDANNRLWAGGITGNYSNSKSGGHLYYSDDGSNWTAATFDNTNTSELTLDRVLIKMAPSNSAIGYAMISSGALVVSFQKTTDSGANWTDMIANAPTNDDTYPGKNFGCNQAHYDLSLEISPTNPDIVYMGCLEVYRSLDGGSSFSVINQWQPPEYGASADTYIHADHHNMIAISSDSLIFANDGGISITTNGSQASPTFKTRIDNYNVGQFYHASIHPEAGKKYALGGTQDNGSWKNDIDNNLSFMSTGGDGAYTDIDKVNPLNQAQAYIFDKTFISNNSFGSSYKSDIINELDFSGDNGWFINPFIMDGSTQTLYWAYNSTGIARTLNYDVSGTGGSQLITLTNLGDYPASSFALSPHTDDVVYVGSAAGGYLYKIENASGTFTTTEIGSGKLPSGGYINSIDVGYSDNQILVSISNFGVDSVWETKDGGSNWIDLDDNSTLPDMPVRWAVYERSNTYTSSGSTFYNTVFLATAKGVWRSNDISQGNSTTWFTENDGMPNVSIYSLDYRATDGHLVAATFGNGLWYSQGIGTPTPTASPATFAIDSIDNSYLRSTSAITVTPDFSSVSNFTPVTYQLAIGSSSSALNDIMDWTTTTLTNNTLSLSGLSLTDYTSYHLSLRAIGTAGAYNSTATSQFNTYSALLGDSDADWDLDIDDMNSFVNAWPNIDIGPAVGAAPYMAPNLDQVADIADMNVFSRNWFWSASSRTINKILDINDALKEELNINLLSDIITIQIPQGVTSGRIQIEKPSTDTKFSVLNNASNMIVLENDNDFYQLTFGNLNKDNAVITLQVSGLISELNIAYEILDATGANETNMIIVAPPSENKLYQNYPNPFSETTTIKYDLVSDSDITIYIYDSLGRLIDKIDEGSKAAGSYSVDWDARNDNGEKVSSGVYFYQIRSKNFNKTQKMLLVR